MDQNTRQITYLNDTDKDKLAIVYGNIQGSIVANTLSGRLKNTQYVGGDMVRGGTVKVRRFKSSVVQDYGTARTAQAGNKLQNNGVDVLINTDRELAEEMTSKDLQLYNFGGVSNVFASRQQDFATAMGIELENAYFAALVAASATVDLSGESTVEDKVLKLIRTAEAVSNENVNKVNRSDLILTLSPAAYDALRKYMTTLESADLAEIDRRLFHGVQVELSLYQDVDAIIQYRGAVAQPVVMDDVRVERLPLSSEQAVYMAFYYGTKVLMSDLCFKGAIVGDISA